MLKNDYQIIQNAKNAISEENITDEEREARKAAYAELLIKSSIKADKGWNIKLGTTDVEYVTAQDEEGNPVYDEEGNQLIEIVTETQTVTHEAQTYAVFIPDDASVQNAINAINEIMNERPVEQ